MGIRKCIVKCCNSSSSKEEDRGVTYHKIPMNEDVKQQWIVACRLPPGCNVNKGTNVCSRHFRKADFQEYKGKKYVLKFGAVPSIFSWDTPSASASASGTPSRKGSKEEEKEEKPKEPPKEQPKKETAKKEAPVKAKEEATKKTETVEAQKKSKQTVAGTPKAATASTPDSGKDLQQNVKQEPPEIVDVQETDATATPQPAGAKKERKAPKRKSTARKSTGTVRSAKKKKLPPSEQEAPKKVQQSPKKVPQSPKKASNNGGGGGNSGSQADIIFASGAKIEAQDFSGRWHTAKLLEVDTEEREVLVQFDKNGKVKSTLNDEWISMDSVRLRPLQASPKGHPSSDDSEDKQRYTIGEKCFARWSDSRKFKATIQNVLDNDMYEVLFDDGFAKICKSSHISKLKKADDTESGTTVEPEVNSKIKTEKEAVGEVEVKNTEAPVTPVVPVNQYRMPQQTKLSDLPEVPKTGEWCCHWMDDYPVGDESEVNLPGGKVYSVVVPDWRLPEGWLKHIFQRTTAYGKMDVVLVNPAGRPFRSRQEVKGYLSEIGETYDPNVYDFGLHKKRSKDLGFIEYTKEYKESLASIAAAKPVMLNTEVNIGSVKVKIINNLYQCPEPDCLKTFRKDNHLQIHIKHYHKELAKGLGEILNMQDLAALRTPVEILETPIKQRRKSIAACALKFSPKEDVIHVKQEPGVEPIDNNCASSMEVDASTPSNEERTTEALPKSPLASMDTTLNDAVPEATNTVVSKSKSVNKIKLFAKKNARPKTLSHGLVTKRPAKKFGRSKFTNNLELAPVKDEPQLLATPSSNSFYRHRPNHDVATFNASLYDGSLANRSSTNPKFIDENGERIKIVQMKKEEIINCLCSISEEDGLMVQCELCLCWQHGICNGFERDNQVPDKYVCFICRNPTRGRESKRFIHDQDWLYEGKLPVANYHATNSKHPVRFDILKHSHTLSGNLLELRRFMHSLRVKINIAEKKDHPKMYLWSKKWEKSPTRASDLSGGTHSGHAMERNTSDERRPMLLPQIPVPEAPIDSAECQMILLEHIQKQQNDASARLQAIEAHIIALESYDDKSELLESPTAKNYPKTKDTIHMLLNDLVKMKKIAAIHADMNYLQQQQQKKKQSMS